MERSQPAKSKKPAPPKAASGRGKRLGRPPAGTAAGDLREQILDVAEEQFAKHGFDGVTTRSVAKLAGTTSAMIYYYFDTKRALFDAAIARRANILNHERLDALDAYEAQHGDAVTVEGAISAFLHPVMEKMETGGDGWRNYLALIAWVSNLHDWGGEVMTRSFDPVIRRLISIIRRALPDACEEDLYWAYHFLSGALVLTAAGTDRIDRLSGGICRSADIAAAESRMIEFAAAGFERVCRKQRITPQ